MMGMSDPTMPGAATAPGMGPMGAGADGTGQDTESFGVSSGEAQHSIAYALPMMIQRIRIVLSCFVGCLCGILGLTNLFGFVFFACTCVLLVPAIVKATEPALELKFGLLTDGLFQSVLSFILMWSLMFALVHIY